MVRPWVVACFGLGFIGALCGPVPAPGHELVLGSATAGMGETVQLPLTLTSTSDVQGVVFVAEWDGAKLAGANLSPGTVLAGADVVVRRVEPSYAVLGVVMDSDGTGEVIPLGTNLIASLGLKVLAGPTEDGTVEVPVRLVDGKYGATNLGPVLDNLIVIRGRSIARTEGLIITEGKVEITNSGPIYRIAPQTLENPEACPALVDVPVSLKSSTSVQGFVIAVRHRAMGGVPGLKLKEIQIGASVGRPDFSETELMEDTGGTLGVVIDLDEPFGSPPPLGPGLHDIAVFRYCVPAEGICGLPPAVHSLEFTDSVLGDPPKENLVIAGGLSVAPVLQNGTLTVNSPSCEAGKSSFAAGGCALADQLDGSGNPIPDPLDPTKSLKRPADITASPGQLVEAGFWYRFPPDLVLDPSIRPELVHQIQGLSMAVCYDAGSLHCLDAKYSLEGTITQAVGAEFVNVTCQDVDPGDPGRKGELVVGILVDALPPFEKQYFPPTDDWLKVICIKFLVLTPEGLCDRPEGVSTEISFCDGANAQGIIRSRNLISVANRSFKPMELLAGKVTVKPVPLFIRGDCNSNYLDQGLTVTPERLAQTNVAWEKAVDISDGAALISYLFQKGPQRFLPPCLDACDTNDDGRVDLADAMLLLRNIFRLSSGELQALFDRPHSDQEPGARTPDDRLDCQVGSACAQ